MNKVFVTGGTSGLGLAIAEKFLAAGNTVYVHGRNQKSIRELLKNPACHFVRIDLLKPGAAGRVASLVKSEEVDCFVNNAGIYSDAGTAISDQLCLDVLTTNLVAPVLILKAVYEHFRASRRGTIVSVNSLAGLAPNFNEAVYCASKYGLKGFIKSLQIDAHRHNVRILDYYPGAIQTRITQKRDGFPDFIKPAELAAHIVSNATTVQSFLPVMQELRRFSSAD